MNNENKRLNIALLTTLDTYDRCTWSDTFYSIARTLQKYCGEVAFIGPLTATREIFVGRLIHSGAHLLLRKNFAYRHTYAIAKRYAAQADAWLSGRSFDIVVALNGATELAFLQTRIPVALFEDANFAVLHNYYPQFSSLLRGSARQLDTLQRRGIERADLLLYPTVWAAQSVIKQYNVSANKVAVIPLERISRPCRRVKAFWHVQSLHAVPCCSWGEIG